MITPLEMTTSTDASGKGNSSANPFLNSNCVRPMLSAVLRDFYNMVSVMSTPITLPVGPTILAAMKQSKPLPEPTSNTVSPGAISPTEKGLPTPAKDSTASSGRSSRNSSLYSRILASGRPW